MENNAYILALIAKEHGVSVDEVTTEIEKALRADSVMNSGLRDMSAEKAVSFLSGLAFLGMLLTGEDREDENISCE